MNFINVRCSILVSVFLISACATGPTGSLMYPSQLEPEGQLDEGRAIVLVGVTGPNCIDYFQFTHKRLPAINARHGVYCERIFALEVPVGLERLQLNTITIAGRPGAYVGVVPVGFISVRTPPVDINERAIYFLGTLDTANLSELRLDAIQSQLKVLRAQFETVLEGVPTVGFNWPEYAE